MDDTHADPFVAVSVVLVLAGLAGGGDVGRGIGFLHQALNVQVGHHIFLTLTHPSVSVELSSSVAMLESTWEGKCILGILISLLDIYLKVQLLDHMVFTLF